MHSSFFVKKTNCTNMRKLIFIFFAALFATENAIAQDTLKQAASYFLPRKNVIKLEMGGMWPYVLTQKIYGIGLDYERSVNKVFSWNMYVGWERPIHSTTQMPTGGDMEFYYRGYTLAPRVRLYLGNRKAKQPRGTFIQFGFSYSQLRLFSQISPLYSTSGFLLKETMERGFVLGSLGHQGMIGKSFTVSGSINTNIKVDNNDYTSLPGHEIYIAKSGGFNLSIDFAIGYAFGVK